MHCLRSCFANFGIPDTVVSDNASCFLSREMQEFLKKNGIRHCTGAPYNPSTNGLAERAVRIFKENFKKFECKLPIKTRVAKFLYTYRRTVQSSTGCSPAELMFGRKFKGPLDMLMPKQEMSDSIESKFKIGDAVYARNFGKGPEWVEAKVTKVLGSRNYLVSVNTNGRLIWKCHLSQLFERKMYSEMEPSNPITTSERITVPLIPQRPVVSPPQAVNDSSVINIPDNVVRPTRCNPSFVHGGVEPVISQSNSDIVLRRSTRAIKKPDKLNEQDN